MAFSAQSKTTKYLNQKLEWAIREEIRRAVEDLVKMGVDKDLALTVLEQVLPENEIFNLPDGSDDDNE